MHYLKNHGDRRMPQQAYLAKTQASMGHQKENLVLLVFHLAN